MLIGVCLTSGENGQLPQTSAVFAITRVEDGRECGNHTSWRLSFPMSKTCWFSQHVDLIKIDFFVIVISKNTPLCKS